MYYRVPSNAFHLGNFCCPTREKRGKEKRENGEEKKENCGMEGGVV